VNGCESIRERYRHRGTPPNSGIRTMDVSRRTDEVRARWIGMLGEEAVRGGTADKRFVE
jgi:hypothetical protein